MLSACINICSALRTAVIWLENGLELDFLWIFPSIWTIGDLKIEKVVGAGAN